MAKIFLVIVLSCFVASVHPQLFPDLSSIFGGITSAVTSAATSATNPQTALTQGIQTASSLLNTVTSAVSSTNVLSSLTNALTPQTEILNSLTNQLTGTNAASCLTLIGNGFKDAATGGASNFNNCINPFIKQASQYQTAVTDISKNLTALTTTSTVKTFTCFLNSFTSFNIAVTIKCYSDAVAEVSNFVTSSSQNIQNLVSESRNLVLQLPSCSTKALLASTQTANALLQNVIGCASGKGVNTTVSSIPGVTDLTSVISTGLDQLTQASSVLTGSTNPFSAATSLLSSATQTASSLSSNVITSTISTALSPALDTINNAVTAATASNNPDFKVCAATAQAAALKILPNATANTLKCTASITTQSAALTAKITALSASNAAKITASNTAALSKCSFGAIEIQPGKVIECLQQALYELNSFVSTSLSNGQQLLASSTDLLSESTKCLGSGSEIAVQAADYVVTSLTDCLRGKGVNFDLTNILG